LARTLIPERSLRCVAVGSHFVVGNSHPHTQLDYSASILAILKRFHYNISNFNGEGVHSLTNVITLDGGLHEVFDQLVFYFESTVSLMVLLLLNHDTHLSALL